VGPEGGWSDAESRLAASHVSLGANVLRVETAALVAVTLMVDRR
jgi:RsmE family RNA methyltransferase